MIPLIKGLYITLVIVTNVNAITSLYYLWPRENVHGIAQAETKKDEPVSTWKNTVEFIIQIMAVILLTSITLVLFFAYKIGLLIAIIAISFGLQLIARTFSSVETIGNIVIDKSNKILGVSDYADILTLAIFVGYMSMYGIQDKIIGYANGQTNTILSDWMLLGYCVVSIAITTFLICSLALKPFKIAIKLLGKLFSRFRYREESRIFEKLKKRVNDISPTKTWTVSLIEYSIKQHNIFCRLLWIGALITIILDSIRMVILLAFEVVVSTIYYVICITMSVGKIFSKIGKWILSLSDSNVMVLSFRIAIILGFGCTVIINQYQPFLKNQNTTSAFEFISSTIIIPVILEWILSYKAKAKNI